jgi:hypothetical protein
MSTHASIWMKNSNSKVSGIYCHFDGYLSHVGRILETYYADAEKAKALISLGNISYLGTTLKSKAGQDVDNNFNKTVDTDQYTLVYGERPSEADDVESMMIGHREEFNYFWNGNDWLFFDDVKWVYLRNVLIEDNIMCAGKGAEPVTTGWSDKKIEVREKPPTKVWNSHQDMLYRHEFLDRVHSLNHMFHELIVDHPGKSGVDSKLITNAQVALAELYQASGNSRFEADPS